MIRWLAQHLKASTVSFAIAVVHSGFLMLTGGAILHSGHWVTRTINIAIFYLIAEYQVKSWLVRGMEYREYERDERDL